MKSLDAVFVGLIRITSQVYIPSQLLQPGLPLQSLSVERGALPAMPFATLPPSRPENDKCLVPAR